MLTCGTTVHIDLFLLLGAFTLMCQSVKNGPAGHYTLPMERGAVAVFTETVTVVTADWPMLMCISRELTLSSRRPRPP